MVMINRDEFGILGVEHPIVREFLNCLTILFGVHAVSIYMHNCLCNAQNQRINSQVWRVRRGGAGKDNQAAVAVASAGRILGGGGGSRSEGQSQAATMTIKNTHAMIAACPGCWWNSRPIADVARAQVHS